MKTVMNSRDFKLRHGTLFFTRRTLRMSIFALRRLANIARSQPWQSGRLQMVAQPTFSRFNSTVAPPKPNNEAKNATEVPPVDASENGLIGGTDWSKSFHGLSAEPFSDNIRQILQGPVDPQDVECKPGMLHPFSSHASKLNLVDGLIYLPEIKYRRILNKAFGPGGWGLAPRSETNVSPKIVSREYALVCLGRLVC